MRHTKHGVAWIGCGLSILLGLAVTGLPAGQAGAQELSKSAGSQDALHGVQLAGTVEGENQQLTGAVFEDPRTKKQTAYRVGDLVDGATIVEIKRQQVVLQRGGERLIVQITGGSPVATGAPGKNAPADIIPVPAGDPQVARQAVIAKVIAPYDPRVEKLKATVSQKAVTSFVGYFQTRLEEERSTLVTTALGPAVDLVGVDPELLDSLRLASTDRIVEISGMDIDSPKRFAEILEILGQAKIVDVSILRGDVVQSLYYTVN